MFVSLMIGRLAARVFEVALTGVVFTLSSTLTKKAIDYFEPKEEEEEPVTPTKPVTSVAEPPLL